MADSKKSCDGDDVVFTGTPKSDGTTPYLRHHPDHTLELGVFSKPSETKPANMTLRSRDGADDGVYDIIEEGPSVGSGPAKVTNDAYRNGWDSIFGNRQTVGQA